MVITRIILQHTFNYSRYSVELQANPSIHNNNMIRYL